MGVFARVPAGSVCMVGLGDGIEGVPIRIFQNSALDEVFAAGSREKS